MGGESILIGADVSRNFILDQFNMTSDAPTQLNETNKTHQFSHFGTGGNNISKFV